MIGLDIRPAYSCLKGHPIDSCNKRLCVTSSSFSFLPNRTVKNEDDVLEMDHQEQTYTITGAADDSDDD